MFTHRPTPERRMRAILAAAALSMGMRSFEFGLIYFAVAGGLLAQASPREVKKTVSDVAGSVPLETKSLSYLLYSPVATMLVPARWKLKLNYEPVENDQTFSDGSGNLFSVSFQNSAPNSEEGEYVYQSRSSTKAEVALCARGSQLIFSSQWQKESNWTTADKRYQRASKIFHDINRFFSHETLAHNQFMDPNSPRFIVSHAEVKKVDGKCVFLLSGFSLIEKTKKPDRQVDEIWLPIPNKGGIPRTYVVGVSCRAGSNLAQDRAVIDRILNSPHWSKVL